MSNFSGTVSDVMGEVRADLADLPQTASDDSDLDKDSIERWLSEAVDILEGILEGSAASLPDDSAWGKRATVVFAAWKAYQKLGLEDDGQQDEWENRRDQLMNNPREIGDVVIDSELVRSNAGKGGAGHWVDGSDGDFTGW